VVKKRRGYLDCSRGFGKVIGSCTETLAALHDNRLGTDEKGFLVGRRVRMVWFDQVNQETIWICNVGFRGKVRLFLLKLLFLVIQEVIVHGIGRELRAKLQETVDACIVDIR